MPKENTTTFIILGLLHHEELSGYDIKKRIDSMIGYFWSVGYGQIYPTLKSLEGDGLIIKREEGSSKGPEKYTYYITETGREKLKAWLATPEQKEYTKYEILLKLFFGGLSPADDNIKRINNFKERQEVNHNMMKLFKSNLEGVLDKSEDHMYYYLTVLFGEKIYNAYLEWAEEAAHLLERNKKDIK
jgi:DNA-binding PadR family transcriptional regulator